jgi:hypothetical protein
MTTLSKSALVLLFQQGDVPQGTDYANFIDSCVNVAETSVQAMQGPLNPTELITARVSATNGNFTGTLSIAGIFSAHDMVVNTVVASAMYAGFVSASRVLAGVVSADTVYASAGRFVDGAYIGNVAVISAAGTTQGTAAIITSPIATLRGVSDGVTTGFAPPANRTGWVQYILNDGPSANLWPPVGGRINGQAANAVFALAASTPYTVVHFAASSMTVK